MWLHSPSVLQLHIVGLMIVSLGKTYCKTSTSIFMRIMLQHSNIAYYMNIHKVLIWKIFVERFKTLFFSLNKDNGI